MDTLFIFGAKYLYILSAITIAIYLIRLPADWRLTITQFLIISLPLTWFLGSVASEMVYNPRPFVIGEFEPLIPHEANNGFPSSHALLVSGLAAPFIFFNRRLAIWLWFVGVIVSYSRVYVGVHHVIDILASILIAILSAYIVHIVLKKRSSRIEPNGNQSK